MPLHWSLYLPYAVKASDGAEFSTADDQHVSGHGVGGGRLEKSDRTVTRHTYRRAPADGTVGGQRGRPTALSQSPQPVGLGDAPHSALSVTQPGQWQQTRREAREAPGTCHAPGRRCESHCATH